jgi:hypothetical protein
LIKGGGGALVREKIVAAAAREMVVVVTANKVVDVLGSTFKLPVEVMLFGWRQAAMRIEGLGLSVTRRMRKDGAPFVSDNGNCILDCSLPAASDHRDLERTLNAIPGVVDCGLFVEWPAACSSATPTGASACCADFFFLGRGHPWRRARNAPRCGGRLTDYPLSARNTPPVAAAFTRQDILSGIWPWPMKAPARA